MAIQWTEYARVTSRSDSSVSYRIDVNPAGEFRCTCKGFIFSHVRPKACLHTRAAEQEVHDEGKPQPAMPVHVVSESMALVAAMLREGHVVVSAITAQRMAKILEPRLANGPAAAPITRSAPVLGVRLIELD